MSCFFMMYHIEVKVFLKSFNALTVDLVAYSKELIK